MPIDQWPLLPSRNKSRLSILAAVEGGAKWIRVSEMLDAKNHLDLQVLQLYSDDKMTSVIVD